ncbi:MAG: glycosyltransferase family 4 protein [Candidatus Paceibacterota bacterium]
MNNLVKKLLMISTDRKIFESDSAVRMRQIEYAKQWDEVHIIVFATQNVGVPSEVVLSDNCWAYSTESISQFTYSLDAIRLGRFIIEKRKISHITCQDPFLTSMAGISLKKRFKIPLEIQLHTDIASQYFSHSVLNGIRKFMALSYLPKADTIRVVSNRLKDYLIKRLKIDDSKIIVRPISIDTEWIKNAPITVDLHDKYGQFDNIVLMASRFEKEKNIDLAINSWKKVVEKLPKAGLIIVGLGSQGSKLRSLVKKLGLSNSVKFETWTSNQTLASYYKTADAFLSTSLYEGYGMTFVEAKSADCSIISTDVGVAKEMGATIVEFCEKSVARAVVNQLSKS